MKKFMNEFKAFAMRGNVIDLAVGVIVGGAFSSITTSLINDIVMPIIGIFLGGADFSSLVIVLPNLFGTEEVNQIMLGNFIGAIINFIILAFVVFVMVRALNKLHKQPEAAPPAPPAPSTEELLLTEIRDLLKEQAK